MPTFSERFLIVAKNTGPALSEVVYPLLCSATALSSYDLSSLIGDVLQTNYVGLDETSRKNIESAILGLIEGEEGDRLEAMARVRDTLLGCIPVVQLVLPESLSRVEATSADGGPPKTGPRTGRTAASRQYSEAEMLRESGVPIDASLNASLREKGIACGSLRTNSPMGHRRNQMSWASKRTSTKFKAFCLGQQTMCIKMF